ncbi:hypothetical protein [Mesobacillus sp.]|uniref:hypothetical protein n=1 Tax=Mesobacillus sp. TaxID=2675271 RepID=UPI0039EE8F0E
MRTIRRINAVDEKIIHSNLNYRVKGLKLAALLREMERDYEIPATGDRRWEEENQDIFALYSKIKFSIEIKKPAPNKEQV